MSLILIAVFLIVPMIEVALFILVGSRIGVFPTLALCVLDAVAGALIVRHQGLKTLAGIRAEIRQGRVPAMELAEGAAIFASGSLLITPGFFSDAVGFVLLVPPARRAIIRWLFKHFAARIRAAYEKHADSDVPPTDRDGGRHITIDADAEDISDDEPDRANRASPWHRRGD